MSALPEGMANGPSRNAHLEQEDTQIWERPWSLEEIRQHSANWSLAADSGLFHFLQDFSHRMMSKTHEIEKQLDSLICDTKATDSRLHSVFNDFLMLSNTQFIENRVYDEEVEETVPKTDALEKQPEQEKTREQKEAELIPKMQEAVNYGLKVLESAFEHLDIKAGNSDSEDEDITERVEPILEPKDLYVDRPLPYLIGSQAFMEQDDVGLGDLSSDEMSVDSDRDSVIDSEDDKETVHSDDDSYQEEQQGHNNVKKSSMVSYEEEDEEEEEDSDIFGESDKDEDIDDSEKTDPSDFANELAARIKGEINNRPEGDHASLSSKKKSKARKESKSTNAQAEEDSDDMFKPPKLDDEDFSPFGGKSGLFSGGKGLFDDDDEGDLFSEAPKPVMEEQKATNVTVKSTAQATESSKPNKKIPAGAVSIFPDNRLFSSGQDSDSEERKENGTPAVRTHVAPKQTPTGAAAAAAGGGKGLFDDDDEEEEDDDFFGGKSPKKPDSIVHKKPKPKTHIDLFDDEDEDGDIFSGSSSISTQSKREFVEKSDKSPEKKMPPGAISTFGPATKSLLSEGLKKHRGSSSEASEKPDLNGLVGDVEKAAVDQIEKPQSRGLFSDDEDSQLFTATPKSQPKPELTSLGKTSKASLSLFDEEEEEEDLFASAVDSKGKTAQPKSATPQPSKAAASSLFSDDEQDQWMSPKSSPTKPDSETGGMKTSTSAPSRLPSAKTPPRSSLFDEEEEDDLFAPPKEFSQKKPQKVALLFEDEEDFDDEGSLFDTKPPVKTPVGPAEPSPQPGEVAASASAAKEETQVQQKPAAKSPEQLPTLPSQESAASRKKPAGAVSLFGGIDVLNSKQTKTPLDGTEHDDVFLSKESPPPLRKEEKKEAKAKTKTVSLFDDDEEEGSDWSDPIPVPSEPTKTQKSAEERPQTKSTGVFQDEELLFSHTQQRDNDPDVDLFATSGKAASSEVSSERPAAPSLFSDDDEDDLFSSVKPKPPPPKIAEKPNKLHDRAPLASPDPVSDIQKPAQSPVKPKDFSSRIGKLQASLMINPAALLPGAASSMSGTYSSSSGVSSSSLSPSPVSTPVGAQVEAEVGVSFESPVQVTTLQSAHKTRVKGSVFRRPQSRAARQQAAQKSLDDKKGGLADALGQASSLSALEFPPPDTSQTHIAPPSISAAPPSLPTPSSVQPSSPQFSPRPSELTLPVTTNAEKKGSSKYSSSVRAPLSSDDDDLFGSDDLFGASSITNIPSKPSTRETTKTSQPHASTGVGLKKDKDTSTLPSIFDDNTDDLFQTVKPQAAAKKAPKVSSFLEEDDDDIFGLSNSSTSTSKSSKEIKNGSSFSDQDIFQDEATTVPKVQKKLKEKSIDASLFDDNIDIFADLTDTLKPKQKSKTKGETKSIFDDDMDDIFSTSTVKPAAKAPAKLKKATPSQKSDTAADSSNLFDDPLNALGGN
ncbi:WASH complex subunit FAM21 isoform X2 [Austrofundulus limnaeus]|uniref:WASH complex subunit FAM21 isoform X2 n=1 Tax=Austrofundulus limnaeus TaxID=52670 RepID=A0A2I4D9H0_AUSLI|nr:PREDICTED: WASH complex subunit FAM21-like isoform X2 [Austrofundulus limnaeus]